MNVDTDHRMLDVRSGVPTQADGTNTPSHTLIILKISTYFN